MARILVTEEIAARGLAVLRDAGHDVDVRLSLTSAELVGGQAEAHIDLMPRIAQATHPAFGDLFGDEDPCHATDPTIRYPRSLAMRLRPSSRSSSPKA